MHDKLPVEISHCCDDFMKIGSMFASLEPKNSKQEKTIDNFVFVILMKNMLTKMTLWLSFKP